MQGCQMVSIQTKNLNVGKFWRALDWKMLIYLHILWPLGIFCRHLGHFMTIWYILCSFGTLFPVLVSCTKNNLATLYVCTCTEKKVSARFLEATVNHLKGSVLHLPSCRLPETSSRRDVVTFLSHARGHHLGCTC
jgi:hypothetical protein